MLSEEIDLLEFTNKVYDKTKSYRVTLDTRDNSCVYTDINNVKVPKFKTGSGLGFIYFTDLMYNRSWTWLLNSKFKYFYVYIIEDKCFLCNSESHPISNFVVRHNSLEKKAKESKSPTFQWMKDKLSG